MTTMMALVGEQSLPNFLPVQHYNPTDVVLVYTTTTQRHYERLKVVLQQKNIHVHGIEVNPYDISAITEMLNEELDKIAALSSQPLVFNLTGGTKMMSLAAYQVAQGLSAPCIYFQSEGMQSVIDTYRWQDHTLYRESREQLPEYMDLATMLDLHLGQGKDAKGKDIWKEKGPKQDSEGGHLFELAIAETLRNHGYEVMCGVKVSNDQVDIDVMLRYQNQVGIIEAKTGNNSIGLKGVQQLNTNMRYLGGIYTKPFLVIDRVPSTDQQRVCEMLRITIIPLLHYERNMTALVREDIDTLLTAVDNVMKAGGTKP